MSEAGGEEIPESVAEDTRSPPEQKAEGAEVSRGELKDEAGVAQSTESEDVGQKPTEIEAIRPRSPEGGGATTKAHEKDGSSGADAGQEAESEVETGPKDADPMGMELEGAERKSGKGDDPTADATEAAATTTTFKKPSFPAARTTTKTAAVAAAAPATPTAAANVSTASTAESDSSPSAEYAEHIAYTADGDAIYTDPQTQHQYKWCPKQNNWIYWQPTAAANTTSATAGGANPYENEHYRWCSERNQWIPKARKPGTTLTQSPTETEHYRWDAEKHAWIPKVQQQPQQQQAQTATARATGDSNGDGEAASGRREDVTYGIDEDGQRIYTDRDGAVFFWDAAKSAWFPKIDDDFMARYQMNYGFIDNTSAGEAEKRAREEAEAKRKALELQQMAEEARAATEAAAVAAASAAGGGHVVGGKRKAPPEPPKWFELNPEQNTKVYVSNLPLDITLDEFAEVMSKCGLIMRDPQTQKYKLKLYTEADGQIKGDGLCDYIKVESVELALKILDEYEVRGHKIRVQRAQFQMRGEYNPALKPKRKKKDKEKLQKMKEKLFDWRPEKMRGERSKNEKVVIIKNLFTPETFEKEVQLILDYQNDLREECAKCGTVRKVVIYDLHAEGVAQVNMSSPEEADLVIQMMHGRFFGQRQLTAEHWDGKTKYKIAETETAVKSRLSNWDQFLETDEDRQADEAGPTDSTEQVK